MTIPSYNEMVIPSVRFLQQCSHHEDAMNQNPDFQAGVGDLIDPPLGDGVNTNLAFIISQFPDEWVFLTERLHIERRTTTSSSHDLYKRFVGDLLAEDLVMEIRLWAAMRTQSVARLSAERCSIRMPSLHCPFFSIRM